MGTLNGHDVELFRKNGYLLPQRQLFSNDKLKRLQEIFEEHLANKGDKRSDQLDTPHFTDERLLEFLLSDEILDVVEPLVGADITLWSSHFISKDPYTGRATPWHEDSAYWKGRLSEYDRIVTVWLALDRSTKENGCMRVIPESHMNGFSTYRPVDSTANTFGKEIDEVDESTAVYFELEPGEYSLHDGRIVHGATSNSSPHRRCGYTMRYLPASVRLDPVLNSRHRVWLARGKATAGNVYVNA